MTQGEAIHKLKYLKKAYQMLIDEKVDRGKLVGRDITGEWKADTPLDEAYKNMIEALDHAIQALEQQTRWIPISEKLPEYDEHILITQKFIFEPLTCVSYFDGDFRSEDGEGIFNGVIAWMPLPKPYKAESEEKK